MAYMSVLEMRKLLEKKYGKAWVSKKSDAQVLAIYSRTAR